MSAYIEVKQPLDYDAISAAYAKEKWRWHFIGVPTAAQIKDQIESFIRESKNSDSQYIASGGTQVSWRDGQPIVSIHKKLFRHLPQISDSPPSEPMSEKLPKTPRYNGGVPIA